MPYKAVLLFRRKDPFPDGTIIAMRAWSVPISSWVPEGRKYSFVLIDRHGNRVLGYDNAHGKGHHRHEGATETQVRFETLEKLMAKFLEEAARWREAQR